MKQQDAMGICVQVAIIGAGFGGLGLAIRLTKSGRRDFVVLERGNDLGGVWRDNTYPGAACDIPSHLYSFSFEPKPDWSHRYARQSEILDYLRYCAHKYELERHIRLGTEVAGAEFDATSGYWTVSTTRGERIRCRVLVSAVGQLSRPRVPELPGLERFGGVRFHSARWNHDCDLAGQRVAVIGSGASAIQFVPEIAQQARRVTVFQRSAPYVIARRDRPYRNWEQELFLHAPLLLKGSRASIYLAYEARMLAFLGRSRLGRFLEWRFRRRLHSAVANPELRQKLTPDYPFGCKRVLLSDDWFETVLRDNVEVVSTAIREVSAQGVVTSDGREHAADVLIFATGFAATDFLAPMRIRGLDGRDLNEVWRHGAEAYLGISVSGFPNLFLLYGPNTNLGHSSIIYMLESQFHYLLECLAAIEREELRYLDVRPEAEQRFNARLEAELANTVWQRGCSNWYLTAEGRNTNNWSSFTFRYRHLTRRPQFEDYVLAR